MFFSIYLHGAEVVSKLVSETGHLAKLWHQKDKVGVTSPAHVRLFGLADEQRLLGVFDRNAVLVFEVLDQVDFALGRVHKCF